MNSNYEWYKYHEDVSKETKDTATLASFCRNISEGDVSLYPFADWLEDQGDPRHSYVRKEAEAQHGTPYWNMLCRSSALKYFPEWKKARKVTV